MPSLITHLFQKKNPHQGMEPKKSLTLVAEKGIVGDASYGRRKRQILLVSKHVLSALDLQPGEIRENIVVEGVDIDSLPSGTTLQIGSSKINIVGPCTPCDRMDEIRPGLQEQLKGRRGVLAQAMTHGEINIGDEVSILLP